MGRKLICIFNSSNRDEFSWEQDLGPFQIPESCSVTSRELYFYCHVPAGLFITTKDLPVLIACKRVRFASNSGLCDEERCSSSGSSCSVGLLLVSNKVELNWWHLRKNSRLPLIVTAASRIVRRADLVPSYLWFLCFNASI